MLHDMHPDMWLHDLQDSDLKLCILQQPQLPHQQLRLYV
jgi:hypothetical protein